MIVHVNQSGAGEGHPGDYISVEKCVLISSTLGFKWLYSNFATS